MSLMIWGCITYNGFGTLTTVNGNINAAKYIEILEDNLCPVIVRHYSEENYIFQDDNAPVHRAQSVQKYKIQNNINGMFWPAQSPDADIIENCWLLLKISVQNGLSVFTMLTIWSAKSWTFGKPFHYIKNLYRSIPTRMLKIIRSNGYITKY